MKKEYIVYTKGKVLNEAQDNMIIVADSKEEAQLVAKRNFLAEVPVFENNVETIVAEQNIGFHIFAFICLLIPILMSTVRWFVAAKEIFLFPDLISTVYAILFYLAYIVKFRGTKNSFCSITGLIYTVEIVWIIGIIVKVLLGADVITLFGFIDIPYSANTVLLAGIVFSWLGINIVSLACFSLLLLMGFSNLLMLNVAMGTKGILFALSTFLGLGIFIGTDPNLHGAIPFFTYSLGKGAKMMEHQVHGARNEAKQIFDQVKKPKGIEHNNDRKGDK